jgi:peptide deformylase
MIVTSKESLTKECETVTLQEGKELIEELKSCLLNCHNGIGLAAPQIGRNFKVVIIKSNKDTIGFINPKILKKEHPFIHKKEGCLSFPGQFISTIRYSYLKVEDDLNGVTELNNYGAVIAEHEIDHINQTLMFDKQVPNPYNKCFCGKDEKFKFCCYPKLKK